MAPPPSRSFGAISVAACQFPCAPPPFSYAAAATTTTGTAAFLRLESFVNPRFLSTTSSSSSSSVPSGLRWKLDTRGMGFRCEASAAAEESSGDEYQVSHLLDSLVRSLYTCKTTFLQDIAREYCCLKGKSYTIKQKSLKGFQHSTDISRSREQQSLDLDDIELVKDKLLIDCGPDQECVTGGIIALGKFDALHIGHRELAIQASKAGTPFLLSFVGMAEVLGWEYRAPVVAKCDRKRVLSSWAPFCGNVAPLEFQVEFSKVRHLTPRQFVERLSKDLRISGVVAGENYRFGYRATGDASELMRLCKEYGLEAYILKPVLDSKSSNLTTRELVSSTRVRQALAVGDMQYVSELLGRKHRLVLMVNDGCVVEGSKISIPKSCMLNQQPKDGFYEICSLLIDNMLIGECRVVIDTRNIHMELVRTREWAFPNWGCQHVSVEFG
uniref:FAD synthase n=1 Tax=Anthurium amnicola TaxID=1678845 RepID=A0A1D1YYS9_9ARAE